MVLVVIINQLNKDVIIKPLKNVTVKMTVWMFIENVFILHRSSCAITSNREPQFVNDF